MSAIPSNAPSTVTPSKLTPASSVDKANTQLTPDQIKKIQDLDNNLTTIITQLKTLLAKLPKQNTEMKNIDKNKAKDQLQKYGPLNREIHKVLNNLKSLFHSIGERFHRL